jgi:hypothetical protein
MARSQRFCAFCGAAGMTKQHVFGKRLLALLNGRVGTHLTLDRSPDGTETKKRAGNVWSRQLRRVCSNCNNGWMRQLEESAYNVLSGLITGDITTIPKEYHGILAARLALMIMVASLSKDEADAISVEERENLRSHNLPPLDWQMFLCRSDCTIEEGQYYYSDSFIGESTDANNNTVSVMAHVTTFVLGKLCVHAISRSYGHLKGYSGINLAQVWPSAGGDIDIRATSILNPTKVFELSSVARRHGFPPC